jgi:putative ABC transport system permease protein
MTKSGSQTGNAAAMSAYADQLLGSLEAIPGVRSAAVTNQLPLAGCCFSSSLFPEGRPYNGEPGKPVSLMVVSAGYFKTLRIPLLAGRLLNAHDTNEKLIPVVVDEAAARRYWPGSAAVGAFARIGSPDGSRLQIVGVVGTVQNEGVGEAPRPEIYILKDLVAVNPMQFVVRSTLPQASLAPAIRRAIAQVDPVQPIYSVSSLRNIFSESLMFQRIESLVVLLLASLGVYGLTSNRFANA